MHIGSQGKAQSAENHAHEVEVINSDPPPHFRVRTLKKKNTHTHILSLSLAPMIVHFLLKDQILVLLFFYQQ